MTTPDPGTPPPATLASPGIHITLTHAPLCPLAALAHVRSPHAGATTLFAGTTRATTASGQAVHDLHYQAYVPRALATLHAIAAALAVEHGLAGVAVAHRLGAVPVGATSVLVAVASAHRAAAWRAGEACLEQVKARAEIWKRERFVGDDDEGGGVWRANRDEAVGVREELEGKRGKDGQRVHGACQEGLEEDVNGGNENVLRSGPLVRPRQLGDSGHGAVVDAKSQAPPAVSDAQ